MIKCACKAVELAKLTDLVGTDNGTHSAEFCVWTSVAGFCRKASRNKRQMEALRDQTINYADAKDS